MNKFNIVGNNHIISQVNSWTITKNYPNAILISGAVGSGRHTLAKSIAKAVVCSGDNPPCLKCINCKKAELSIHPDIEIITGAKGLKSFHIDAIRDMRSRVFTKPNEAAKRVIILENAHNMTEAAQNASLFESIALPINIIGIPASFTFVNISSHPWLVATVIPIISTSSSINSNKYSFCNSCFPCPS